MLLKRFTISILFIVLLGFSTQTYAQELGLFDASAFDLPDVIAGYPVLAVKTSDNASCMKSGTKSILLQTTRSAEDFWSSKDSLKIDQALNELRKTDTSRLEYGVISDKVPYEEIAAVLQDWSREKLGDNCPEFSRNEVRSPLYSPLYDINNYHRGQTIIKNGDSLNGPTNDNAQGVKLIAPHLISNLANNDAAGFLNNITTNNDFILQDGIGYINYNGTMVSGLVHEIVGEPPKFFDMALIPGTTYLFTVTFTSGAWWFTVLNLSTQGYEYFHVDETGFAVPLGTNLHATSNTSVWVEVISTNSNWHTHFSDTFWTAMHAQTYFDGIGHNWSSSPFAAGTTSCPNPSAPIPPQPIQGDLTNGHIANFKISDVLIQCP